MGLNLPSKGYDTVFASIQRDLPIGQYANKLSCGLVSPDSRYGVPFVYMLFHATGVIIQISASYLLWLSFEFHTFYMISLLLVSAYSGANYYTYMMTKSYEKILK